MVVEGGWRGAAGAGEGEGGVEEAGRRDGAGPKVENGLEGARKAGEE